MICLAILLIIAAIFLVVVCLGAAVLLDPIICILAIIGI